jgi:trimethylamine--corrinoid protein Co-methyltransferase
MLVPGDMLTGIGSLRGDSVSSITELLLSAELFEIVACWSEGYDFSADAFQLDAIDAVGPTGHFLDQDHTLAHMREFWRDTFMDRRSWDAWEAEGRPTPAVAAAAEAARILATHEPLPLPEEVAAELDRIMGSYEREALSRAM